MFAQITQLGLAAQSAHNAGASTSAATQQPGYVADQHEVAQQTAFLQHIHAAASAPDAERSSALKNRAMELATLDFTHMAPDLLAQALLSHGSSLDGEKQLDLHGTIAAAVVPQEHAVAFSSELISHLPLLPAENRLQGIDHVLRFARRTGNSAIQEKILDAVLEQLKTELMADCEPGVQSEAYSQCAKLALALSPEHGKRLLEKQAGRAEFQTDPHLNWRPQDIARVAAAFQQHGGPVLNVFVDDEDRIEAFNAQLKQCTASAQPPERAALANLMHMLHSDVPSDFQRAGFEQVVAQAMRLGNDDWAQLAPDLIRSNLTLYGQRCSSQTTEGHMQTIVSGVNLLSPDLSHIPDIHRADDARLMEQATKFLEFAMEPRVHDRHYSAEVGKTMLPGRLPLLAWQMINDLREQTLNKADDPNAGPRAWQTALGQTYRRMVSSFNCHDGFTSLNREAAKRGPDIYLGLMPALNEAIAYSPDDTHTHGQKMLMMLGQGRKLGADVSRVVYAGLVETLPIIQERSGSWQEPVQMLANWVLLQPSDAPETVKAADRDLGLQVLPAALAKLPAPTGPMAMSTFIEQVGQLLASGAAPAALARTALTHIAPHLESQPPSEGVDPLESFVRVAKAFDEPDRAQVLELVSDNRKAALNDLLKI